MLPRYGDPNDPSRTGPNMEEDYVQLPVPGNQGVYGSATGRGAIGPLSPSHPAPLSRIILRDLKLLITLNQEEEQEAELGALAITLDKMLYSVVDVVIPTITVGCLGNS